MVEMERPISKYNYVPVLIYATLLFLSIYVWIYTFENFSGDYGPAVFCPFVITIFAPIFYIYVSILMYEQLFQSAFENSIACAIMVNSAIGIIDMMEDTMAVLSYVFFIFIPWIIVAYIYWLHKQSPDKNKVGNQSQPPQTNDESK